MTAEDGVLSISIHKPFNKKSNIKKKVKLTKDKKLIKTNSLSLSYKHKNKGARGNSELINGIL